jgi:hypothetical protein
VESWWMQWGNTPESDEQRHLITDHNCVLLTTQ